MSFVKVITVSAAIMLAAGCQGNDPFDRQANPYPEDIQRYTPEPPEAADEQTVKVKTFDVSAEGQLDNSQVLHFVAGETSEYRIVARSFVDQTQFQLKGHNLPSGANLTAVSGEPGVWVLRWTPAATIIPTGQQGADFDVTVEFVVASGTSPRAQYAHAPFEKMTDFRLTVRHSDRQPIITSASQLDSVTSVRESQQTVRFDLVVVDPMSNGDHAPELVKRQGLEISDTSLPGSFALFSTGAPVFQGSGEWKFPLALDLKTLADHYRRNGETGSSLNISISLKAESTVTINESPLWSKTLSVELDDVAKETN